MPGLRLTAAQAARLWALDSRRRSGFWAGSRTRVSCCGPARARTCSRRWRRDDRRSNGVARGRRPRRIRVWHGDRRPDAPLSRAAARRDDAADRPCGARQRLRRVGRRRRPGRFALSTQRYAPDVLHPDGAQRIAGFTASRGRRGNSTLADGTRVVQELLVEHGTGVTRCHLDARRGRRSRDAARPAVSLGPRLSLDASRERRVQLRAEVRRRMGHLAPVRRPAPRRPVLERRLPARARLVSELSLRAPSGSAASTTWRIWRRRGVRADAGRDRRSRGDRAQASGADRRARVPVGRRRPREGRRDPVAERTRRARFATPLDRAADAYLVARQRPHDRRRLSVVHRLGPRHVHRDPRPVPRDGRLAEARDILLEWAGAVSEGMLPNRFPDAGETPEFNSVDASLWFVVAVHDCLASPGRAAAC